LEEETPVAVPAPKLDTEALKKEKLTLIQRKSDIVDDKKTRKRNEPGSYKVGFSSVNADLLGF
jgi:hypothetical protein